MKFFSKLLKKNRNPLMNILIRTSNRPNYFRACYESIISQTYRNYNIFVSYDNAETLKYLNLYKDINKVKVKTMERNKNNYPPPEIERGNNLSKFPPEFYMNDLMNSVKSGYILYLDDDDYYTSSKSLEIIANHITTEDTLLFWRVQFPEKIIPEDEYFGEPPAFWHCSTIGFCFHQKYIPYAQWDGWRGSDYLVAHKLYKIIPHKIYINKVLTGLQRKKGWGGLGLKDDK